MGLVGVREALPAARRAEVDQEVRAVDSPIALRGEHWPAESLLIKSWQDSQCGGASVPSNRVGFVGTHPLVDILASLLGWTNGEGLGESDETALAAAIGGENRQLDQSMR